MNEDLQEIIILNQEGKEQKCRVVFTFDAEEKSYVLLSLLDEQGNEVAGDLSAMTFDYDDNTGEMTNLQPVESDEEWEMINEVVLTLLDEFEKESKTFMVTDDEGNDQLCEVIHMFSSDSFNKSYVLYKALNDSQDEQADIFAAQFVGGENGEIEDLLPIETEEEWEFVEDILNSL